MELSWQFYHISITVAMTYIIFHDDHVPLLMSPCDIPMSFSGLLELVGCRNPHEAYLLPPDPREHGSHDHPLFGKPARGTCGYPEDLIFLRISAWH